MSHAQIADAVQAARAAVARHAWHEAFDLLTTAATSGSVTPEDLEVLAEVAWWTGRHKASLDAFERAYAGYLERGALARAGFVALTLASEYQHTLAHSIAAGWFSRARSLLEGVPDSREYGHLVLARVSGARAAGDLEGALAHAREAVGIGRRFGDRDLEALALQIEGQVLVAKGEVTAGLALLDEATVAAVAGELSTWAGSTVYCRTISSCRDLADYRRAGEWTEAATRWCERQAIAGFPGVCRVHRAEIMRLRGAWGDAEREARRACDELMQMAPDIASGAFYEIGEIRLRLGDTAGAEEAFRQAHELGRDPQPGLALLRLREGRVDAAWSSIRRALADKSWDRLARARLLPAHVEIAIAAGDLASARSAAEELEEIAKTYLSPAIQAAACCASGAVRLEEGEAGEAARSLRRGWQLWREIDLPYEASRARMLLAAAYRAEGDDEAGVLELQAARTVFERLGAVPDARRARALLGEEGASAAVSAAEAPRATRTFMFTDIVKSTSLVEALGDEAWGDLLHWHDETLRGLFTAHGGREINHTGDGFFVGFREAAAAIDCAVAIQRKLAEHRRAHGFSPQVRIGLHTAEAARRGLDYGGKAVHEAARIAAVAEGGEILARRKTLDAGPVRYPVSRPREVGLRGLVEPVQVAAIEWR